MDLKTFCTNQNVVYESMRDLEHNKTLTSGIEPDTGLMHHRGGFFLSLMHETAVVTRAADLSLRLGKKVPAVTYTGKELHTTAGSIFESQEDYFYFDDASSAHKEWLAAITQVALEVAEAVRQHECAITFAEPYIVCPQCVVAPGRPHEGFIEVVEMIKDKGLQYNIALKQPWGAHMTLCRFTKSRGPDEAKELVHALKDEPTFGTSHIVGIAAGYTRRSSTERHVTDLRDSRGPFHSAAYFPFK